MQELTLIFAGHLASQEPELPRALVALGIVVVAIFATLFTRFLVTFLVESAVLGGKMLRKVFRKLSLRDRKAQAHTDVATDPVAAMRRLQRAHAVTSLLRAASTAAIVVVTFLSLLDVFNLDVTKILTAAGVASVVVGFGARALVQDILAGLGLIIEEQFGVGDVIEVGERSGTVEEIRLRVTRLRDDNGTVWYLRNGAITELGNQTKAFSRALVEFTIRYDQDLSKAWEALYRAGIEVCETRPHKDNITSAPKVEAIEEITTEGYTVRLSVKTIPTRQRDVARQLRISGRKKLADAKIILAEQETAPDLTDHIGQGLLDNHSEVTASQLGPLLPPSVAPIRVPSLRRKIKPKLRRKNRHQPQRKTHTKAHKAHRNP